MQGEGCVFVWEWRDVVGGVCCVSVFVHVCVCVPQQSSDNDSLVVLIKHHGEEYWSYSAVSTNVIVMLLQRE